MTPHIYIYRVECPTYNGTVTGFKKKLIIFINFFQKKNILNIHHFEENKVFISSQFTSVQYEFKNIFINFFLWKNEAGKISTMKKMNKFA